MKRDSPGVGRMLARQSMVLPGSPTPTRDSSAGSSETQPRSMILPPLWLRDQGKVQGSLSPDSMYAKCLTDKRTSYTVSGPNTPAGRAVLLEPQTGPEQATRRCRTQVHRDYGTSRWRRSAEIARLYPSAVTTNSAHRATKRESIALKAAGCLGNCGRVPCDD